MKNYKHTLNQVQSNYTHWSSVDNIKSKCFFCYKPLEGIDGDFHTACNKRFFGQLSSPEIDYGNEELRDLASKIIKSQMVLTGSQPKLPLSFHKNKNKNPVKRMTVMGLYGDYILTSPSSNSPYLPVIKDLTMKLSNLCGIKTVPHSLIRLTDETICYISKRIDRTRKEKLPMEDFCQLSGRLTEEKFHGSYEEIAKLIVKHSTNPYLDLTNFYEIVLFSYFTGNANMHLKNFSLWASDGKNPILSPAYNLANTTLANSSTQNELALTINGQKNKITYHDFLNAFENTGLNEKILNKMLYNFYYCHHEMIHLIEKSFLNEQNKEKYKDLIEKRFALIPKMIYNG